MGNTARIAAAALIVFAVMSFVVPRAQGADATTIFDDVPGFGRSEAAVLRDETVALYEAWQREVMVADCMSRAGFSYRPEFLYSPADARQVAGSLGVVASTAPGARADDANESYLGTLSALELDRYHLTLWGETAADLEYVDTTSRLPLGRDPAVFASGGCRGAADAAIPGIWELPRQLFDALMTARAGITESAAFQDARTDFDQCVSSITGFTVTDLSELESLGTTSYASREAYRLCYQQWVGAIHLVETTAPTDVPSIKEFIDINNPAAEVQRQQYQGIIDRIRANTDFKAWLSRVLYYVNFDDADH